MSHPLSPSELEGIALQLEEFANGFSGYLGYLRGENEEMADEDFGDLPWKPIFFLLAGAGRVQVYKRILREHGYVIDDYTGAAIAAALEDAREYVLENKKKVKRQVDEAFDYLIQAYRDGYLVEDKKSIGWSFDDFLEERDLIEFFLLGVEEQFSAAKYAMTLFEEDCIVRERINELGLENYAEEYFPGRLGWYPKRFWWHHRPENRIPHPDGLES